MPYTDIVGTVVKNPTLNTVNMKKGGSSDILNLRVASSELKGVQSQFFNITVFGKAATHIFNCAKKGSLILAHCEIKNKKHNNNEYTFLSVGIPQILRSVKSQKELNNKDINIINNHESKFEDEYITY